jgi:ABC-type nitrate/sulfonate/bicarbonate transport system ATPase subunit
VDSEGSHLVDARLGSAAAPAVNDKSRGPAGKGVDTASGSGPARAKVRMRDVGFAYPTGTEALASVHLDIVPGQVVSVVGPSGCGKSTLLQLISGLAKPTSGQVHVDHASVGDGAPISMVFQVDTLVPWLKVSANATLANRFSRFRKPGRDKQVKERAAAMLEMVGLASYADMFPYQLSGGMRRRLACVTAMAPLPGLLLLDEPFSAVDEPTRVQIHQDVLNIVREFGMTVVLATHDLAEAVTLSDRVVILSKRPGTVIKEHVVPFGRQRNVVDLRQSPEFLRLYGELWTDLSGQLT